MNVYNPMADGILKSFAGTEDILQKGEGDRGGKVIGHTKSGKPIYDTHGHEGHKKFTKDDHDDATRIHATHEAEILGKLNNNNAGNTESHQHYMEAKKHSESSGKNNYIDHLTDAIHGEKIGETKSGRDIYAKPTSSLHNDFSKEDHMEAANLHGALAEKHITWKNGKKSIGKEFYNHSKALKQHYEASQNAKGGNLNKSIEVPQPLQNIFDKYLNQIKDVLEKGGEGSKGGKVIGHTKSGKPIYDKSNHEGHKDFSKDDHQDAADAHMKIISDRAKTPHSDTYHDEQRADHSRKVNADDYRDSSKKYDKVEKGLEIDSIIDKTNISILDNLEKGRKGEPIGTRKRWGGRDYVKTANGWTPRKDVKEAHDKIHQDKYESENKDSDKLHYTKDTEIHAINKIAKEGLKTTKHHNVNDGSGYFEIHKDKDESDNEPKSFDDFKSSVKIERGSGYGQYSISVGGHKFHSTNSKAFDADPEDDNYDDVMKTLYYEYKNSLNKV